MVKKQPKDNPVGAVLLSALDAEIAAHWAPASGSVLAGKAVLRCRCGVGNWEGDEETFIRGKLFSLFAAKHKGPNCGPERRGE